MQYFKLQLGCMMILVYIAFIYYKECKRFGRKHKLSVFDLLFGLGVLSIFFDGATAYMVNNLDKVNPLLNLIAHGFFLLSIDGSIFLLFLYMLSITTGLPKQRSKRILLFSPFVINVLIVLLFLPMLKYRQGELSNYSMGISAYTCYIMAGMYILLTLTTFFGRWKYIESHKRLSIFTYLLVLIGVTGYQMLYPQVLLSSIGITIIVVGVYINQENPAVEELSKYHKEMVMGFATLVENKDGSTGGHIRRTSLYVKLLAEELRRRGFYREELTKDYMNHLFRAAPMHDIGKIAVPDMILQKPGKLSEEEFEVMKLHTVRGGDIIKETFGHLENKDYTDLAYQVARYHHEKWNGRGYPEGLKKKEIPLCARIMTIADVFDATSMKRCYRDAMKLDQCFEILQDGSGQDFEPLLVEVFLEIRAKVEAVYKEIKME